MAGYLLAALIGVVIALLGSDPSPIVAVVAVLVFPVAASAADVRSRPGRRRRQAPLGPALLTALSGGVLAGLLARLAFAAPGWETAASADCGAASTGVQQLVVWSATLIFLLALIPVGLALAGIGARLAEGRTEEMPRVPLALYPLAVAGCGLALIGAGFATNCG